MISRLTTCVLVVIAAALVSARSPRDQAALDAQVARFLDEHRDAWHDMNVPEADGRALHDLILEKKYGRVLEIGTSTGRSAIWMAWALSRTRGRLTTIEIDEDRHAQAVRNFKDAGVADFITATLGDAHEIVRRLAGPFDMVFIDADKDWYTNYAKAVLPRLVRGGALTAHNVSRARWPGAASPVVVGERDFYGYVTGLRGVEIQFRAGIFVAFKQ